MPSEQAPLHVILDDLERTGREDAVSVGDVVSAFEHRSLGFLLAVFGLIAALPVIGGVPGMSVVMGSLILLAVAQSAFGRGELWIPSFVKRREIGRDRFQRGLEKSRRWVEWIDKAIRPRLTLLSEGTVNQWLISAVAAFLAITFFPLAVVPYGVTAPTLGVLALGLGLIASDGLLVLAGYLLAAATVYVVYVTI